MVKSSFLIGPVQDRQGMRTDPDPLCAWLRAIVFPVLWDGDEVASSKRACDWLRQNLRAWWACRCDASRFVALFLERCAVFITKAPLVLSASIVNFPACCNSIPGRS